MSAVLCPTRGGEASYATQDFAIELARERGQPLVFLYVSDVRFLFMGSGAAVGDLEENLDDMGEFLLTMALERAEAEGILAEYVLKHGSFRDALVESIAQLDVGTVVFGAPSGDARVMTAAYLGELAQFLRSEVGVEAIIVGGEEIAGHEGANGR
jgi:nucleotide-binding universal stress UspA family protein